MCSRYDSLEFVLPSSCFLFHLFLLVPILPQRNQMKAPSSEFPAPDIELRVASNDRSQTNQEKKNYVKGVCRCAATRRAVETRRFSSRDFPRSTMTRCDCSTKQEELQERTTFRSLRLSVIPQLSFGTMAAAGYVQKKNYGFNDM